MSVAENDKRETTADHAEEQSSEDTNEERREVDFRERVANLRENVQEGVITHW